MEYTRRMSFFAYAWMASIVYGFYAIVAKLIGKYQLTNVWQFSFFSMLFGGMVMSIIALSYGAGMPTHWGYLTLAGAFMALGSVLYLTALKMIDVSVLSALFTIQVVAAVLLGYVFLGETLSPRSIGLIGMIVGAGFFASMDERFSFRSFFSKSTLFGLFMMLILSIQRMFINRAIDQNGYWTSILWLSLVAAFVGFVVLYPQFKNDLTKTPIKHYLGVLVLSLFGGLADLAAYKAFEGNLGISSVIISLPISMVLAFLFSLVKPELLEKHPVKVYVVRFVAAGVMVWGALQLSG